MVRRVDEGEVKVDIAIEELWRALTKDLNSVVPLSIPKLVKEVKVLEGDGGSDTVYLFEFGSDVMNVAYQKEKVVDFDESLHHIGLQVIEGGRLNNGFSFYKTSFQLTAIGESKTGVKVKVDYETESQQSHAPNETIHSTFAFIRALQTFLQK